VSIALERVIPILRIFDVAKAREFYVEYLGFSVDFEHRFHENAPLFMSVSRGDATLFLSEHHGDGTPGTHVVVQVQGIADLHRELKAKNYRYMNPEIQTQEWGTRELTTYDPFNNHVTFSERIT
jgi:uncharacterized glyoxalase superfamily protein PhnB